LIAKVTVQSLVFVVVIDGLSTTEYANLRAYFVLIVETSGCGAHLAKPDGVFFLYLPRAIPDKLTRSD
jgi:hypothetical protein